VSGNEIPNSLSTFENPPRLNRKHPSFLSRMTANCIFMDTVCEVKIPAWRNELGGFLLHPNEREAQLEIADDIMERLFQFQQGEPDFEDALTVGDFIVSATTRDDGTFVDLDCNSYGPWEILEVSASLPQS
jgi:hypothetical protein